MKKFIKIIFSLLFIFLVSSKDVYGEDDYYVKDDGKDEIIASFDNYSSANNYYNDNVEEYDNLVLYYGETVLKMEYGVVEFKSNDSCSLNIEYTSTIRKNKSSINACYMKDGAYLYSSSDASRAYFKVGGDIGYTSSDDVLLHPIDSLNLRVSSYINTDGTFNHLVRTQFDSDYLNSYAIDDKLDYLNDDTYYYSYDGHYFYDDFKKMIDDYNNETYENAINSDNPYYNYYQYLSYRSLTNYNLGEIEDYYYNTLNINSRVLSFDDKAHDGANDVVNSSQYYGELSNFFVNQNIYGTNALMLLSTANLESSSGKSYNSFVSNNLFALAAYDNDIERDNKRYTSIANSISSYSKYYVSDRFSNYRNNLYAGNYLGNKLGGISLNYAQDPNYGEKVASNYYLLDKALGYKDKNNYCFGISNNASIKFYKDEELNNQLYTLSDIGEFSLIILGENDNSYKVQLDYSFNDDYKYDFKESVAYVNKDIFNIIFNSDKMHENDVESITYYTNVENGIYTINALKDSEQVLYIPSFDNYEYKDAYIEDDKLYLNYVGIDSIEMEDDMCSLDNYQSCTIRVHYSDNSNKVVQVNSDMVSSSENKIQITYHGVSILTDVYSSDSDDLTSLIKRNIESYQKDGSYNIDELKKISGSDVDLGFDSLRTLDAILLKSYHRYYKYHIYDNDYGLSLSGVGLNLASNKSTHSFLDTYYIKINKSSISSNVKDVIEGYGLSYEDSFKVSFYLNYHKVNSSGQMVYSIKPENKSVNKIYSVYKVEGDNIIKCRTIQTEDSVKFISDNNLDSTFVLLSKDSVNTYNLENYEENLSSLNDDPDTNYIFTQGIILIGIIVFGSITIISNCLIRRRHKHLLDHMLD